MIKTRTYMCVYYITNIIQLLYITFYEYYSIEYLQKFAIHSENVPQSITWIEFITAYPGRH